jgi:hypothetical protein
MLEEMCEEDSVKRKTEEELLTRIKERLPELQKLLEESKGRWYWEDPVYRFYHQSHKVYWIQERTKRIVEKLREFQPEHELHSFFTEIVQQGTGITFDEQHNRRWTKVTRPILEAYFHALYFLEMVVKYGKELECPPQVLPSGWAAVLELYRLR